MTRLRRASALLAGVCALAASLVAGSAAPARADGCQFILGFKTIHDALVATVGDCVDNQAFAANGDALQHSVKGLLAWRKADNWTAFTDGYHTWVNGPNGIQERLNTERFPFESDQTGQTASGGSASAGSCPDVHNAFANSCSLGNVGQGGVTVKSRIKTLTVPYDRDAWDLVIADHPQALYVTLQDLWYSMGVQVWQKETQTKIIEKIFRAGADEFKRRTIQFVMPEALTKWTDTQHSCGGRSRRESPSAREAPSGGVDDHLSGPDPPRGGRVPGTPPPHRHVPLGSRSVRPAPLLAEPGGGGMTCFVGAPPHQHLTDAEIRALQTGAPVGTPTPIDHLSSCAGCRERFEQRHEVGIDEDIAVAGVIDDVGELLGEQPDVQGV